MPSGVSGSGSGFALPMFAVLRVRPSRPVRVAARKHVGANPGLPYNDSGGRPGPRRWGPASPADTAPAPGTATRGRETMAEPTTDLLEIILKDVATAGAQPWYAAEYTQATGLPREAIDACLDRLRLSGLVRLTDWVQGQGYALTPEGAAVLENPRLLNRLREGRELPRRIPARPAEAPPPPPTLRESGTPWDRGEAIRAALLNPGRPVVTQTLLALNVVWFLYGMLRASQEGLLSEYLSFGGGDRLSQLRQDLGTLHFLDLVVNGQWWRLLSYCFVHLGIIHLAMNMWVLYAIGSVLEAMWGNGRYLVLYLISGLGGGCAQLLLQPGAGVGGASGALCGLMTSMAIWVWLNRPWLPQRIAQDWMRNIMMNIFLIAFISMVPGVSWAGHLGGAVAGAVVAVPLVYSRFGRGAQRWLGWAGVAAVPLVALALVYHSVAAVRAAHPEELGALPADDRQVLEARKKYLPIYQKADSLADEVLRKYGLPLLEGTRDPKESRKQTAEAVAEFNRAAKKLKGYADSLGGADNFGSRDIAAHVAVARLYAGAWAEYYQKFARSLEPITNWTDQRRQELRTEWRVIARLADPLRESTLFKPTLEKED
jgi:membrane associated rhomboid family serine protease